MSSILINRRIYHQGHRDAGLVRHCRRCPPLRPALRSRRRAITAASTGLRRMTHRRIKVTLVLSMVRISRLTAIIHPSSHLLVKLLLDMRVRSIVTRIRVVERIRHRILRRIFVQ